MIEQIFHELTKGQTTRSMFGDLEIKQAHFEPANPIVDYLCKVMITVH